MGENVIHKLAGLDLSWGTIFKLVILAVIVGLLVLIGIYGSKRVAAGFKKGVDKVKEVLPSGATPAATTADPRFAGV